MSFVDLSDADDDFDIDSLRLAEKKQLAISVYREVWNEFYTWEAEECRRLMSELSGDTTVSKNALDPKDVAQTVSELDLSGEDIIDAHPFTPCSSYEACAPDSRNRTKRDDEANDSVEIMFIPYADEPNFDAKKFFGNVDFGWQYHMDTDFELIEIETARRLHFGHNFSFEEIDQCEIVRRLRISNQSGLLWDISQRDEVGWPGTLWEPTDLNTNLEALENNQPLKLPTTFEYAPEDVLNRVISIMQTFCINLNCIESMCWTHRPPFLAPALDRIESTVTNESMKTCIGSPCGDECYRHFHDEKFTASVHWEDESDTVNLMSHLKIFPDLLPCELSVLVRKPCREILAYRCQLISDMEIQDEISERAVEEQRPLTFLETDPLEHAPTLPCNHKGACDIYSGCTCIEAEQHCKQSCLCDVKCKARRRGCNCKPLTGKKRCDPQTCRCRLQLRECDPELCRGCKARDASAKICQNNKIQLGIGKHLQVRLAKYGLGAFATCRIHQGDYIGEYIGEYMDSNQARDSMVTEHLNLNYQFSVNSKDIIDGARLGNETRYINHGSGDQANTDALVLVVNGDLRIGIYANRKIKSGEELLLDYGPAYWKGNPPA